jgi:hypothetical protein
MIVLPLYFRTSLNFSGTERMIFIFSLSNAEMQTAPLQLHDVSAPESVKLYITQHSIREEVSGTAYSSSIFALLRKGEASAGVSRAVKNVMRENNSNAAGSWHVFLIFTEQSTHRQK